MQHTLFCLLSVLMLRAAEQGPARLYDYDPAAPLDYQATLVGERGGVKIFDGSYASPGGGRVPCYLVMPPGKGPFAGVIFQHGGGQSRLTYLSEAVRLARLGAACLITDDRPRSIDPEKPEAYRDENVRMVVDMRRAIDLLSSRPGVDERRIAYVGHSYGANLGGVLSAVDARIKTIILAGGVLRLTEHIRSSRLSYWQEFRKQMPEGKLEDYLKVLAPVDAVNYIGASGRVPMLIQCARFDDAVTEQDCRGLYETARGDKRLAWYDADHDFHDLNAILDRAKWLRNKLRLKRPLRALRRGTGAETKVTCFAYF